MLTRYFLENFIFVKDYRSISTVFLAPFRHDVKDDLLLKVLNFRLFDDMVEVKVFYFFVQY